MNRLERRPQPWRGTVRSAPLLVDRGVEVDGFGAAPDDLSSIRGLAAGIALSAPVWIGLGYLVWKILR